MTGSARARRVTGPLDEKARARLIGGSGGGLISYASSGSEHSAADGHDASSPCLSELVHCFLEDNTSGSIAGYDSDPQRSDVSSAADCFTAEYLEDIMRLTAVDGSEPYRNLLLSHVMKAAETFSYLHSQEPLLRRKVMSFLRELGYNAGICKTRWDSSASGSLTAGNYEFIDVVASQQQRYVVDLDFAAQFEIARPTCRYSTLTQLLPRVYVGRLGEDVKRIVKVMCDAAKRSLKSRDLTLPPWRKNRYMVNKWFGPYKRTVNQVHGAVTASDGLGGFGGGGVKFRCVGFDDAVSGRLVVRTR